MKDKIVPKIARNILTFEATLDKKSGWTGKWNKCYGEKISNGYQVAFIHEGSVVRKLEYDQETYRIIKALTNSWINNKILNRSALALAIWDENAPQNTLRRRLEQKASWNTFTGEEKKKIIKEIEHLLNEMKESFRN